MPFDVVSLTLMVNVIAYQMKESHLLTKAAKPSQAQSRMGPSVSVSKEELKTIEMSDVSSMWLNWIHPQWAPSIKFPKAPRHCLLLTCIFTLCRFDPIYPWNYICIIYFQPLYIELSSAWVDFIIVFSDQSSPEKLHWEMFQFKHLI